MNCVVENAGLKQRLQCPAVYYVTRTVEELVDIEFQPGVFKDTHGAALVEFYEHIDVTLRAGFGAGFAACHRPEDGGMCRSKTSQFGLVRAERLQRVLDIQTHSPTRV